MSLSITVSTSIITGQLPHHVTTLTDEFSAYRHGIRAVGGFWDASFSLRGNLDLLEEWLEAGLGRHIVVRGPANEIVWEGFVDKVTITYGSLSITRGPLTGVTNAVSMKAGNARAEWKLDPTSVTKWGYFFKILSFTDITTTQAQKIRDMYLERYKEPEVKQDVDNARHEINIVVDCAGYSQLLANSIYYYPETVDSTWNLSAKMKQTVALEANQVFTYEEHLTNPSFEDYPNANDFTGWTESGTTVYQTGLGSTYYTGVTFDGYRTNTLYPNHHGLGLANAAPGNVSSNPKVTQAFGTVSGRSYATLGWTSVPRKNFGLTQAYQILDGATEIIATLGDKTIAIPSPQNMQWRLVGKPFVASKATYTSCGSRSQLPWPR